MAKRKLKPGTTRWVELANGATIFAQHAKLERRWETINFRWYDSTAEFSRTTGKICNDPKRSPILLEDPGFKDSKLKEIL